MRSGDSSFSPCGRRWREAPDEGFYPQRELCREETTPYPSSLREATLSHRGRGHTTDVILLPSQLRRLRDAIKSFQREDRIRKLVRAAVQHRAGEGEEFLLHRLRVRE